VVATIISQTYLLISQKQKKLRRFKRYKKVRKRKAQLKDKNKSLQREAQWPATTKL